MMLAVGAVVLLVLIAPRADRQSFSYELNQPWRYPLLTADFDTPIMRDSASARELRDSIDATFIPFARRNEEMGRKMALRLSKHLESTTSGADISQLTRLVQEAYGRGIMDASLYQSVSKLTPPRVRISINRDNDAEVVTEDASGMLSPAKAFTLIDSVFVSRTNHKLTPGVADALSASLSPNITIDTVADTKFRSQEYMSVNSALGVIKKGQRIVDRGEIITPQVFTILNTYQEILEKESGDDDANILFVVGQTLYFALMIVALMLFLALYRPKVYADLKKMTFIISFVTLFTVAAIEMFEYVSNGIYLVPFAIVPILIIVFIDARSAIFSLLCVIMLTAVVATFPFQFIFMELAAGLAATFSLHQLTRRSQLLRTALITFAVYVLTYLIINLMNEGNIASMTWKMISIFALNAVVLSFAYILILVVEKIFGFTSKVTLVELSDINTPILRKMAEVAPGTFQHSIQVSTLAAEAARAIGADSLLVRAGALYHDIGKTESPIFFTENQHGVNPHEGLDPETSAHKIISHVTDGISIASREKLPSVIKDFISQHHGRGLTKYFYNTAVNNAREGETVDPEKFRYPGPDPQTRETSILMLADCVEAASRSLKDFSSESINNLVDKIVDSIVDEGRLKDSPLSLHDIETIKSTFKKRLATIYHSRIAYPDLKSKPA